MKKLYLNLIAGALISSFLLGWLIDTISEPVTNDEFVLEKQLVSGFIKQLETIPAQQQNDFAASLAQQFNIEISFAHNQQLALPKEILPQLVEKNGLVLEDEQGFYLLKSSLGISPYHIQLRLEKPAEHHANQDLFLTVGFYFGICIFMWVWLGPLTQRLSLLNSMAMRFASGDLNARIEPSKLTYIAGVESVFNRMASQIQQLIEENQLLASSMSHDIRTPVACLRFGLDAAIDSPSEQKRLQYLHRMENDLDQMESMLNSYLEYATLEKKGTQIKFQPISVDNLLQQCEQQLAPKLNSADLTLTLKSQAQGFEGDQHWIARAIINLLNNAAEFADSTISLTITKTTNDTFIEIEDDGPGIDIDNQAKVFQPFFQEESHRNRATKNYGLGLAIVAKVVDWHFGSIRVEKSPHLGGAHFIIQLPCKPLCNKRNKSDTQNSASTA